MNARAAGWMNVLGTNACVIGTYLKLIGEYQKSLEAAFLPATPTIGE